MAGSNKNKTLITGNGFDLAHNLPTSYKDFINFVLAFETYKGDKSKVAFDAIFATSESKFDKSWLEEVRRHYGTEEMSFDLSVFASKLDKTGKLNNAWLDYFKPIQNIETWIDFEKEIGGALKSISNFNLKANQIIQTGENLTFVYVKKDGYHENCFYLASKAINLHRLGLLKGKINNGTLARKNFLITENAEYFYLEDLCFTNGIKENISSINTNAILNYLLNQLSVLTELFEIYLKLITGEFYRCINMNMLVGLTGYSEIFTLNYTKTISSLYASLNRSTVHHLHGEIGGANNIVIGVAFIDKEDEEVLGVHALGFTKYYQTLFKETKFGFLDEDGRKIQRNEPVDYFVWGHSLDRSDEKYIRRLFEEISNTSEFNGSRITIYFHSESSKASLLKNLLAIIGKEVIEKSIRLKFLKFLKAPYIWKDQLFEKS